LFGYKQKEVAETRGFWKGGTGNDAPHQFLAGIWRCCFRNRGRSSVNHAFL